MTVLVSLVVKTISHVVRPPLQVFHGKRLLSGGSGSCLGGLLDGLLSWWWQ